MVTVAHERGTNPSASGWCTSLRHLSSNASNDAQAAHGAPQRRWDFMGSSLTNVRINRALSVTLTCFFLPENDFGGGDANTSYSGVFLNRVNNSVPGRHGFMFETAPETPLRQNAGFWLKVKLQRLCFFLRTVIRPNERKHACCQKIYRNLSFVSCTEHVPWHTLSISKTENKCVSIFRNTLYCGIFFSINEHYQWDHQ